MPKVVILGGGVAGMSAAHELIERGFAVDVYEKKPLYLGGKARSVDVPGSTNVTPGGTTLPLPGEHGFRFFPGFYKHITDTMKRIPYTSPTGKKNRLGVFDNLVDVTRVGIFRNGKTPITTIVSFPKSLADIEAAIAVLHTHDTGLLPGEARFFAHKIWQLMTSCQRRRDLDYEKVGWWQFMDADNHSPAYQHLLVEGLTRTLVAANAKLASTKTGGDIFIQLLFNIANPGMHTDRVLNGPTNDVWLKPWEDYLVGRGVRFFKGALVEKVICTDNKVLSVEIQDWQKTQAAQPVAPSFSLYGIAPPTVNTSAEKVPDYVAYDPPAQGDYFLLATPVEVVSAVLDDALKQRIGSLQHIDDLAADVAWMNGIQFYLNEPVEIVKGHCIYVDSEWALTSISQLPFWVDFDSTKRSDGAVKTIFSVDISDWDTPSLAEPGLPSMKANKCQTFDEIADRVWAQLKRSLNVDGLVLLRDEMRYATYVDTNGMPYKGFYLDHSLNEQAPPAATDKAASVVGEKPAEKCDLVNHEPLLINTVNSWAERPDAFLPGLDNLFLASDYVRTNTDLATMEGANEAARRAVNCIIETAGAKAPYCEVWDLHEPSFFKPLKWFDEWRYRHGMPYGKAPGWLDAIMVVWGIIYGAWFLLYIAWTFVSNGFAKLTKSI